MDNPSKKRLENESSIEREIRQGRSFSLNEAIGREGGTWFKGESAVPRLSQITAEITNFIDHNVSDVSGALRTTLRRRIKENQRLVAEHEDEPLAALRELLSTILRTDTALFELVGQVDAEWGQMMLERPHFQEPGQAPHPEDEYTHESVRRELERLLKTANA